MYYLAKLPRVIHLHRNFWARFLLAKHYTNHFHFLESVSVEMENYFENIILQRKYKLELLLYDDHTRFARSFLMKFFPIDKNI